MSSPPSPSRRALLGAAAGMLVTATFGDGDSSFAPTANQTVDLAAFAIGTERVGPIPEPKK